MSLETDLRVDEDACGAFSAPRAHDNICQECGVRKVRHGVLQQYPKWVVVDVETTGVQPHRHDMLEIAALHVATGDAFTAKTKPPNDEVTVHKGALDTNKVNLRTHLGEAEPYHVVDQAMFEWLNERNEDDSSAFELIGKNPTFDLDFLQAKFERTPQLFHDYRTHDARTLMQARDTARNQRLGGSQTYYDKVLDFDYTHNALDDVLWETAVWLELLGFDHGLYFKAESQSTLMDHTK